MMMSCVAVWHDEVTVIRSFFNLHTTTWSFIFVLFTFLLKTPLAISTVSLVSEAFICISKYALNHSETFLATLLQERKENKDNKLYT